jgi:diaminopimelate decarboxylase
LATATRKTNTGGESSKHGIWHENLDGALKRVDEHGLDLVGLHMHIGSGTDFEHLQKLATAMASQLRGLGRDLRAISAGGGLPIPYRAGDAPLDVGAYFRVWDAARRSIETPRGHAVQLEIEPGRFLVAESGVLLAEVRATKTVGGNRFVLIDAGFDNLVRPAMYGSWHEISIAEAAPRPARAYRRSWRSSASRGTSSRRARRRRIARDRPRPASAIWSDPRHGRYGASQASNYNSAPRARGVDRRQLRPIRR